MTELRDGDEVSIEVPDGLESCLVCRPARGSAAAACKSIDLSMLAAATPARLVAAAGAVRAASTRRRPRTSP